MLQLIQFGFTCLKLGYRMKILRLAAIAILAIALPGLSSVPGLAQSGIPAVRHGTATSVPGDPEFSPLEQLASKIDQLGTSAYPSTYIGAQIGNGRLSIYVLPVHNSALLRAIASADTARLPYTIAYGNRSYAVLAATSKWIANNQKKLGSEGIAAAWWGSYASKSAIRVALQAPTNAQLTRLRSATARMLPALSGVTRNTYASDAVRIMNAQAPVTNSIILYSGGLISAGQPSGFKNDTKPFDGADLIQYTLNNTENCTSNFSYNSQSNPSNHVVVTAAHCSSEQSGHDFYTCATTSGGECNYNIGTVSQVYYNQQDFELMSSSNEGYVWNTSTGSKWSVNGYITAVDGDYLTTDGQHGAHYDILVTSGGTTTCATYGGHEICHALVLYGGGTDVCPGGDSGGPILQRESDGYHIHAAGLIDGKADNNGAWYCYAQQVYWIRQAANLAVIWGN